jgi:hypothetical protein
VVAVLHLLLLLVAMLSPLPQLVSPHSTRSPLSLHRTIAAYAAIALLLVGVVALVVPQSSFSSLSAHVEPIPTDKQMKAAEASPHAALGTTKRQDYSLS